MKEALPHLELLVRFSVGLSISLTTVVTPEHFIKDDGHFCLALGKLSKASLVGVQPNRLQPVPRDLLLVPERVSAKKLLMVTQGTLGRL